MAMYSLNASEILLIGCLGSIDLDWTGFVKYIIIYFNIIINRVMLLVHELK